MITQQSASTASRGRLGITALVLAAGALAVGGASAGPASAGAVGTKPVIPAMSITGMHYSPECRYEWCLRLTFRAWDPQLLGVPGATVRWRLMAYRYGDRRLVGNWTDVKPNNGDKQAWVLYPRLVLRKGQYIGRLVVTSQGRKATKDRFFRVS